MSKSMSRHDMHSRADLSTGIDEWRDGERQRREIKIGLLSAYVVQVCNLATNGFYPSVETVRELQERGLAPIHPYSMGHRIINGIPKSGLVGDYNDISLPEPDRDTSDWVEIGPDYYDLTQAKRDASLTIGSATSGSGIRFTPAPGEFNNMWDATWVRRIPEANSRYELGAKSAYYATMFEMLGDPEFLTLTRDEMRKKAYTCDGGQERQLLNLIGCVEVGRRTE